MKVDAEVLRLARRIVATEAVSAQHGLPPSPPNLMRLAYGCIATHERASRMRDALMQLRGRVQMHGDVEVRRLELIIDAALAEEGQVG